ncbi:Disks large like [Actinidia chinensis var. chinensis]|uniref:Disks large like n=1 Tax=Actinidia chinensis var. chinensis TaxID=1590841 RepID=A0A2R6QUM4_ACTCC|nr:Disks large like [Actinidia chinensis var. chinensis]
MEVNSLESPLEALAFNDLSFGFLTGINNLWTWVAVITAAVSFWRIRASGTVAVKADLNDSSPPRVPSSLRTEEATDEPAFISRRTTTAPPMEATEGATRGKFTVYFEKEWEGEGEGASEEEVDDGGVGSLGAVFRGGDDGWCENWENLWRMRIRDDMGWYRYQDLTVMDGNVVKLWDGGRGRSPLSFFRECPVRVVR